MADIRYSIHKIQGYKVVLTERTETSPSLKKQYIIDIDAKCRLWFDENGQFVRKSGFCNYLKKDLDYILKQMSMLSSIKYSTPLETSNVSSIINSENSSITEQIEEPSHEQIKEPTQTKNGGTIILLIIIAILLFLLLKRSE